MTYIRSSAFVVVHLLSHTASAAFCPGGLRSSTHFAFGARQRNGAAAYEARARRERGRTGQMKNEQESSPRCASMLQLHALTERQMQFWEDVDDGLNDVADYYQTTNGMQDIDRVREFAKSAQGMTPPPEPMGEGHEPSEEHVDGLTANPYWDPNDTKSFPWAEKLETNANVIMEEFEAKLARDEQLFANDSAWQNDVMGAGWSAIRLQRLGVWNTANCDEFPRTYELIRSLNIPLAVRGVCFARQGPQSGVGAHSDGRNFILTAHLGVKIPKGCWIKVGGEERGWEEGKLTILDTSFSHCTGNPTDEDRHVLIIDFWHPELTEAERAGLELVYDLRNKFESGEVPYRKPRALKEKERGGIGGLWDALTGSS